MATIKVRDWVEPAHPVLVQRYDDLISIYQIIKNSFQEKIDQTFDHISRQIGFIVTTTLPVTVTVSGDGRIEKVEFTTRNLQGTLFENEFKSLFRAISEGNSTKITVGTYPIYLLWHDALKLKLRTDWLEPAHFKQIEIDLTQQAVIESASAKLNPGVREPAHWFNAAVTLDREEEILLAAIDEVYVDLKLGERVAVARRDTMKYVPGIREPAHFRQFDKILEREDALKIIAELKAVIEKFGL